MVTGSLEECAYVKAKIREVSAETILEMGELITEFHAVTGSAYAVLTVINLAVAVNIDEFHITGLPKS